MLANRNLFTKATLNFLIRRKISLKAKELQIMSNGLSNYIERIAGADDESPLATQMVEFVQSNGEKLSGVNPADREAVAAFKQINSRVSLQGHFCPEGDWRPVREAEVRAVLL
jgi:hypothetical protein